jgi:hypothetical protein
LFSDDVKERLTPLPAKVIGQGAGDQGAGDAAEGYERYGGPGDHGPYPRRTRSGYDDEAAVHEAGGANSRDSPTDDEDRARWRDGARKATKLEYDEEGQVCVL